MEASKKYVKLKDQREHILLRPDMYIGGVKIDKADLWIMSEEKTMIKKNN